MAKRASGDTQQQDGRFSQKTLQDARTARTKAEGWLGQRQQS